MRRRLLQRLEQRVERIAGEHVRLIDDVDLVRAAGGRQVHLLAQVAHLVDAAVRSRVDLDQVERRPRRHLQAGLAPVAWLGRVPRAARAVERLREEPRGRGLAGPATSAEEVCVRDAAGDDRALQRSRRRVLADQVARRSASGTCDKELWYSGINNSKVAAHPHLDRGPPARTEADGSGQDGCGTPGASPYRCFLPDLTGFGDPRLRRSRPSTPLAPAGRENPDLSDGNSVRLRRIAGTGYRQHPT